MCGAGGWERDVREVGGVGIVGWRRGPCVVFVLRLVLRVYALLSIKMCRCWYMRRLQREVTASPLNRTLYPSVCYDKIH